MLNEQNDVLNEQNDVLNEQNDVLNEQNDVLNEQIKNLFVCGVFVNMDYKLYV